MVTKTWEFVQEVIDEYMAGKFPFPELSLGDDVVEDNYANEDECTIKEFEEFKVWLENANQPKSSSMPPPAPPQRCPKCKVYPCVSFLIWSRF